MLPNAGAPRLLVPVGNPTAAARAMLRFSAALSTRDTVKRLGRLRPAAGPGRRRLPGPDHRRASEQARCGATSATCSVSRSTSASGSAPPGPTASRCCRSSTPAAAASPSSRSATPRSPRPSCAPRPRRCERLAEADLPARARGPRLLHLGTWEGATVLAMTALDTSFLQRPQPPVRRTGRGDGPIPRGVRARAARPLPDSPLWDQMVAAQQSLVLGRGARAARRGAGPAPHSPAADRPLPLGGWHGDWTPWNMSRRRGRLQLWDWERFETGVPRGLDRCHYGVNAVTRRDGHRRGLGDARLRARRRHQRPRHRGPRRRGDLPRRHRLPLPRRRRGRPGGDHRRAEPGDAGGSGRLARAARGRASVAEAGLRPPAHPAGPREGAPRGWSSCCAAACAGGAC